MFVGIFLLLLGILMLLEKLGVIHGGIGGYLPAIAIITIGAELLFRRKRR